MLEQVKGQETTMRMLKSELQKDVLPQTLLFYGPDGSGKFLTAVEVARILNCEAFGKDKDSPNVCTCPSCTRIRNLSSDNLYIIERSNLKNAFDIWKLSGITHQNVGNFIFDLKRLIYLLLDPRESKSEESESDTSNRRSKKGDFESERKYFEEIIRNPFEIIEKQEALFETIDQVLSSFRKYIIVLEHIRELQRFLNLKSSTGKPRVTIISGAENMNEEASNRLLKTSEEPPENAYIILISKNIDLMRETVKSRCMRYRFKPIGESLMAEIIEEKTGFRPAEDMIKWDSDNEKLERIYHELVKEKERFEKLYQLIEQILSDELLVDFLYYTIRKLREEILKKEEKSISRIYTIETIIKEAARIINGIQHGNLNPETSLIDFALNYLTPNI